MSIWPQVTWIVLTTLGMANMLQKDKNTLDYIGTFLATGLQMGLLYAGGFFAALLR